MTLFCEPQHISSATLYFLLDLDDRRIVDPSFVSADLPNECSSLRCNWRQKETNKGISPFHGNITDMTLCMHSKKIKFSNTGKVKSSVQILAQ